MFCERLCHWTCHANLFFQRVVAFGEHFSRGLWVAHGSRHRNRKSAARGEWRKTLHSSRWALPRYRYFVINIEPCPTPKTWTCIDAFQDKLIELILLRSRRVVVASRKQIIMKFDIRNVDWGSIFVLAFGIQKSIEFAIAAPDRILCQQ